MVDHYMACQIPLYEMFYIKTNNNFVYICIVAMQKQSKTQETNKGPWLSAISEDTLRNATDHRQQSGNRVRRNYLVGAVSLITNGILSIIFGIVWMSLKCELSESGTPVWTGLWVGVSKIPVDF